MELIQKIRESILTGQQEQAVMHTRTALEEGIPPAQILSKAMITAMDEIGSNFSKGIAYLPELIAAGNAMSKAVDVMREKMVWAGIEPIGTIVLGTIFEDVHDIGKNIVKMNFEGAGFRVVDLGVDVQPEQFIKACKENGAVLVGISALLSTTMLNVKPAIKQIRDENLGIKIMVGGSPFTEEFAERIGADGYAPDAYKAVRNAKKLLRIS